jgi:hypothetical protein
MNNVAFSLIPNKREKCARAFVREMVGVSGLGVIV